jgi:tRNA(Arg) A34 adenosine deaminase TadA
LGGVEGAGAGLEWAFIVSRDRVVYAASAPVARQGLARTATTELIQGIFERYRDQSFFILREPIWLSGRATALCRGMAKVAAKRLIELAAPGLRAGSTSGLRAGSTSDLRFEAVEFGKSDPAFADEAGALALWPGARRPATDADFLALAARVAGQAERGPILHRYHRAIGAVIARPEGGVLAWAGNRNAGNKTRHAELNAIQAWVDRAGRAIPPRARVYCTDKPCRMCAGAIWQASEEPSSIEVIYSRADSGALARATALDLGSEERRRASRDERELRAPLLRLAFRSASPNFAHLPE